MLMHGGIACIHVLQALHGPTAAVSPCHWRPGPVCSSLSSEYIALIVDKHMHMRAADLECS